MERFHKTVNSVTHLAAEEEDSGVIILGVWGPSRSRLHVLTLSAACSCPKTCTCEWIMTFNTMSGLDDRQTPAPCDFTALRKPLVEWVLDVLDGGRDVAGATRGPIASRQKLNGSF